jgi:hypothetical protein
MVTQVRLVYLCCVLNPISEQLACQVLALGVCRGAREDAKGPLQDVLLRAGRR